VVTEEPVPTEWTTHEESKFNSVASVCRIRNSSCGYTLTVPTEIYCTLPTRPDWLTDNTYYTFILCSTRSAARVDHEVTRRWLARLNHPQHRCKELERLKKTNWAHHGASKPGRRRAISWIGRWQEVSSARKITSQLDERRTDRRSVRPIDYRIQLNERTLVYVCTCQRSLLQTTMSFWIEWTRITNGLMAGVHDRNGSASNSRCMLGIEGQPWTNGVLLVKNASVSARLFLV
jgi:hypothetical protein